MDIKKILHVIYMFVIFTAVYITVSDSPASMAYNIKSVKKDKDTEKTVYTEIDEQIKINTKLLMKNQDDVSLLVKLSELYSMKGDYELAQKAIKRAVALQPKNSWALRVKGSVFTRTGDFNKAKQAFKQARQYAAGPEDEKYIYYEMANMYLQKDDAEKALFYIEKALSLDHVNNAFTYLYKKIKKANDVNTLF